MSTSLTVPCPSCEAKVVIKNPNLIGTKVECPKCKYRFKVEAPKEEAAAEAPKPKPEKKPAKSKKKLVGAVLGVLAVVLLIIVGARSSAGATTSKRRTLALPGPRPFVNNTNPKPDDPANKEKEKEKNEKDKAAPPVKRVSLAPESDKDATNLLPGQSVAVYRYDFEKLRQSHLSQVLVDRSLTDLFRTSMGFDASNVATYIHCIVGEKERAPFGLIRLRDPLFEREIRIVGVGKAKSVGKNLNLAPVKGNPFLTAIANAFAARSLFADLYPRSHGPAAATKEAPLGICIYDTQHIMVGDYATLDKFLGSLKDGYPEFQTVWKKDAPPPPKPAAKKDGPNATTPMPMPKGSTVPATPMGTTPPAKDAPPPKLPAAVADKDFTSNPSYLSVSGDLKKLLNTLETDPTGTPPILMAEKFNYAAYVPDKANEAILPVVKIVNPVLSRTAFIGLNVAEFTPRHCSLNLVIVGKSGEEARQIAIDELTPALTEKIPLLAVLLDMNLTLRNYADPNAVVPGSEDPSKATGQPMSNLPGPMSRPMSGFPGPMSKSPGYTGSGGKSPGSPSFPGPMSKSPGYTGSGGKSPGSPNFPGPMSKSPGSNPGYPGTPGQGDEPPPPTSIPSYIDLHLTDRVVTVSASIYWTDKAFNELVQPRLFGFANELKGKTLVYAGNRTWTGLAQAVVKYVETNKKFPPGTLPRPAGNQLRLGLTYPPIQRLSFFTELLPFVGRGNVRSAMTPENSWFEAANIGAAESWVPEFLVFYYDPSAWRAHSPVKPGHAFGGTNYVAIAGVGPDAARFNAANKSDQKLMGISGYDWGSNVDEVTDGLANTIFLLQAPRAFSSALGGGRRRHRRRLERGQPHGRLQAPAAGWRVGHVRHHGRRRGPLDSGEHQAVGHVPAWRPAPAAKSSRRRSIPLPRASISNRPS